MKTQEVKRTKREANGMTVVFRDGSLQTFEGIQHFHPGGHISVKQLNEMLARYPGSRLLLVADEDSVDFVYVEKMEHLPNVELYFRAIDPERGAIEHVTLCHFTHAKTTY